MKNLEYYLSLNYPVELVRHSEEDGGGYMATIPQLGRYAFIGDGETVEEALASLSAIKEDMFQEYLDKGIEIPEPVRDDAEEYSGKILLRIPTHFHADLVLKAKSKGVSLNQHLLYLLAMNYTMDSVKDELEKFGNRFSTVLYRDQFSYSFQQSGCFQMPEKNDMTGNLKFFINEAGLNGKRGMAS